MAIDRKRSLNCSRQAMVLHQVFHIIFDSSSSDSDSDLEDMYMAAMLDEVEAELQEELDQVPEIYRAEPGRPRTLEEGMARFSSYDFPYYTRFSKEQIRYPK